MEFYWRGVLPTHQVGGVLVNIIIATDILAADNRLIQTAAFAMIECSLPPFPRQVAETQKHCQTGVCSGDNIVTAGKTAQVNVPIDSVRHVC